MDLSLDLASDLDRERGKFVLQFVECHPQAWVAWDAGV